MAGPATVTPASAASSARTWTASAARGRRSTPARSRGVGGWRRRRRRPRAGSGCPPRPGRAGRPTRRVERHRTHGAAAALVGIAARCSPDRRPGRRHRTGRTSCAPTAATASRCPASACGRMSTRRWPASWAASTRIRPADGVDLCRHPVHRRHDAGDVRRAGHGEQCDPTGVAASWASRSSSSTDPSTAGSDVDDRPAPPPWQEVRVVLEDRRQHHRVVGASPSCGRSG